MNGSGRCRSMCPRRIRVPRANTSAVDCGPRQIEAGARFAALTAPVPACRAGVQQSVENHVSDRSSVDQRAADIVGDIGVLGDQPGHPVADLGDRIRCGVRNRLRDSGDHDRQNVVVHRLDQAGLRREMVLHQPEGHSCRCGDRAQRGPRGTVCGQDLQRRIADSFDGRELDVANPVGLRRARSSLLESADHTQ